MVLCQVLAILLYPYSKLYQDLWRTNLKQKKNYLYTGYGLPAILKLFMAFANTWIILISLRVLERVGKGVRMAPRDTMQIKYLKNASPQVMISIIW